MHLGHLLMYCPAGLNKGTGIIVVFRHTSCYGKNIGVKDNILSREADALQ